MTHRPLVGSKTVNLAPVCPGLLSTVIQVPYCACIHVDGYGPHRTTRKKKHACISKNIKNKKLIRLSPSPAVSTHTLHLDTPISISSTINTSTPSLLETQLPSSYLFLHCPLLLQALCCFLSSPWALYPSLKPFSIVFSLPRSLAPSCLVKPNAACHTTLFSPVDHAIR